VIPFDDEIALSYEAPPEINLVVKVGGV